MMWLTAFVFDKLKKMFKKKGEISNIANSLLLASSILIFHVILLAGIGILVLFFSGIFNYFFWIFLACSALISGAVYLFYRYMKKEGGTAFLKILSLPELKGKNVEVNLLGGLASFKIARDKIEPQVIESGEVPVSRQLEDPDSRRIRELTELARMLEKNLITLEEYHQVKKSLLN
jgi:hypothetical protein